MKKIIIAIFLATGLFAQNIYKVATSSGYPPFSYAKDGEFVGFDVDLINEVAKILNIKVEFMPIEFDGIIAAIKAGKIDVSPSMSETPARAKNVEFSKPYYESINYYVKLEDNDKLNSLKDLSNGAKIGAQLGTLQADEISAIKGVKPFLNPEHMVFILATINKKIDGFILEAAVAKGYMKNYPELKVFATTSLKSSGVCMAFKKGNTKLRDDFDNAIQILKDNGTYQKLLEKYELN